MATLCEEDDLANVFRYPQCLIDTDDSGKFVVCSSVLDQLRGLGDAEIVVVAIVGPYRTGKSYLMNRLCGRTTGFPLGSTVQSKTKGIWIWVRVHPSDPQKYLILLDTEGLGDIEKGDQRHDDAICCLATLLSSTFVYNNLGNIDNDSLMKLHFVSILAKRICSLRSKDGEDADDDDEDASKNEDGEANGDDDDEFTDLSYKFPDFIYVIRDFNLDLEIDGQVITSDKYLENSLSAKPESSCHNDDLLRVLRSRNRLRHQLRRIFPRRRCFTFVRPVAGKTKDLETMRDEELDAEFIDDTGAFERHIFETSRAKVVGGRRINGKEFSLLIEQFVEQVSREGFIRVTDVLGNIRDTTNKEALDSALTLYRELMVTQLQLPVEKKTLVEVNSRCLQVALELFQSKAVFLDEDSNFQNMLTEEISKMFDDFAKNNESARIQLCREVLEQLHESNVGHKLQDGVYAREGGHEEFRQDMIHLEEEYKQILGNLATKDVLLRFRVSHSAEKLLVAQVDSAARKARERVEADQRKRLAAEQQKEAAERERQLAKELMVQRQEAHRRITDHLSQVAAEQLQQIKRDCEEMQASQLREQERLLKEGFSKEADKLKTRIAQLQRR